MAENCRLSEGSGSPSRVATSEVDVASILANRPKRRTYSRYIPMILANQQNGPETPLARCRGLSNDEGKFANG